jgi:hypothetical protein
LPYRQGWSASRVWVLLIGADCDDPIFVSGWTRVALLQCRNPKNNEALWEGKGR